MDRYFIFGFIFVYESSQYFTFYFKLILAPSPLKGSLQDTKKRRLLLTQLNSTIQIIDRNPQRTYWLRPIS